MGERKVAILGPKKNVWGIVENDTFKWGSRLSETPPSLRFGGQVGRDDS